MRLTVINGSPRGINSNSKTLLDVFLKGFSKVEGNTYELVYLKKISDFDQLSKHLQDAENVIIAFPLYFDSMPAMVKEFFESLGKNNKQPNNKRIGFIVQSGFPEPNHFKCLERYLNKYTSSMRSSYIGTVIRGSGEGIRIMHTIEKPVHKIIHFIGRNTNLGGVGYFLNNKRTLNQFYQLGLYFGQTGEFNKLIVEKLAKPYTLSKIGFFLFALISKNLYFNVLLKNNNALDQSFSQPLISFNV